jgi:hypothetical protein
MPQVMRSFDVVYSPAGESSRRSMRSCRQLKRERLNYLINFLLKIFLLFRRPSALTLAILCRILSPLSGCSRLFSLIISSNSFSSKGHYSSSCKEIKIFYFIEFNGFTCRQIIIPYGYCYVAISLTSLVLSIAY